MKVSCPYTFTAVEILMESSTSLRTSLLGPSDLQQNNGMKFSRDRKNDIDFQ